MLGQPQDWGRWKRAAVRLYGYAAAVALVAGATLLSWALRDVVGEMPYLAFYPAVVGAAALGGLGPGLVSAVLSALLVDIWLTPPYGQLSLATPADWGRIGLFLTGGIGVSIVSEMRGRMQARERRQAKELAELTDLGQAIIFDLHGRILRWCKGCVDLYGFTAEQAIGRNVHELLRTQFPQPLATIEGVLREAGRWEGKLVHRRANGTEVLVASVWVLHRNASGQPGAILEVNTDITALRGTEQQLELALEASQTGTWDWDIITGKLVWSERCLAMHGLPPGTPMSYERFLETVHPEDRQHIVQEVKTSLAERLKYRVEKRVVWPDGSVHWIASHGRAFYDPAGRPLRMIGTTVDITETKRAEAALVESEEKFRLLAENSRVFIAIVRDRRVLYANPFLVETSGYTQEELLSLDITELIHPDDRQIALDHAHQRQRGAELASCYEYRLLDKTGEVHWVELWGVRIEYLGAAAALVTAVDITQRRQAEESLRRSEEQFRHLAEVMPQMVWIARPDGSDEYLNSRCYEFLGAGPEQLIGEGWSKWLHPEDYQRTLDRWHHSVSTGEPLEIEYRFRRASDGAYRWQLGRAVPVRDQEGGIVRWFGTTTDIHEQKQLQEQLSTAQRAAEQARQSAEEASRAKDHFLAMLSHELRTPLTPVLATVRLLQVDPRLDPDTRHDLEVIRRNTELEAQLIDDLLHLTRIARGKIDLNRRLVELCEVILHAVEVCRPDLEARQLHFGVDMGTAAPYVVDADPARLQQVFWNLLKNAIKFTPHGGCVAIRCQRLESHVRAEVNDSGEGIEPEALERIFKPFEQAQASIARQFGGLGLGLAISKTLVEMHGGTIAAYSAGKGRGATFCLELPLASGQVTESPESRTAERSLPDSEGSSALSSQYAVPGRTIHILLVEDHADAADVLSRLLKRGGHDVQTVGDVATALETIDRESIDLLLSDLGLPDRSGLELIRELRTRGLKLPAIALSGYGQEEDVKRSREAGFNAHLTKPVNFDQLFRIIAELSCVEA